MKEISPKNYRNDYENNDHILLDVRNTNAYRTEHMSGAMNIPFSKLPKKLKAIPDDKTIVCVCRDGERGYDAARYLQQAGYDAANLAGGVIAWRKDGGEMTK